MVKVAKTVCNIGKLPIRLSADAMNNAKLQKQTIYRLY